MRAKQLIVERKELAIPAWDGDPIDMPNPPYARDDEGQILWGRPIDRPARRAGLRDLEVERSFGPYLPDAYAGDERSEEARVWKEGVSTCRSRWEPNYYKKITVRKRYVVKSKHTRQK